MIAIEAKGIGKLYTIGQHKAATFREHFTQFWSKNTKVDHFWALKDVNFSIQEGQVVGIIGRNGAGKSTLLKILSKITHPSTGKVTINGRLASLLEVGTGFHPELTGIENIFLNGTILGMSKMEIRTQLDAIIDFSGVEKFIKMPVKHFSSGMYVRLAFSVAAHLNPEILVIDEVLAVGDYEFQKKCLGKMEDVAKSGRTVIFVSHNLAAVQQLCSTGIILSMGELIHSGPVEECVEMYTKDMDQSAQGSNWVRERGQAGKELESLEIRSISSKLTGEQPNLMLDLLIEMKTNHKHPDAFVAFDCKSIDGTPVFQSIPTEKRFITHMIGSRHLKFKIDLPPMIPGAYLVSVWVGSHYTETIDWVKDAVSFEIRDSPLRGRTLPHSSRHGYLIPKADIVL